MPITTAPTATSALSQHSSFARALWHGLSAFYGKIRVQKKPRRLRIEETLPLGERRYLAVVQWENVRLLLGVTAQGISLLEPRAKQSDQGAGQEEKKGE
jgi:flagellar biogenesis protein FliO